MEGVLENDERANQVKEFEETKAGVKGLVDSGVATIPKLFVNPRHDEQPPADLRIPVIDLKGGRREGVTAAVRAAAEEWGIFQVVNHGILKAVMEGLLEGVWRFHEQRGEEKAKWYSRDHSKGVRYFSNGYLLSSPAPADWRDSLACTFRDKQLK